MPRNMILHFLLAVASSLAPASLALAQPATGDAVNLTRSAGHDRNPRWSPDGEQLVFQSERDGNAEIYVMAADGSDQRRLTVHPAADSNPAWSPDALRIVFQSDRSGSSALYVLNLADGGVELAPTRSGAQMPDWSPDGRWIAFTAEVGGVLDLFKVAVDGGTEVRLTEEPRRDLWPRWSSDGTRLTFFSRRDTGGEDDEVYVMDADGENVSRISHEPGHDFCPAWSPDGQRLIWAKGGVDDRRLIMMSVDGSSRIEIARGFERVNAPSWSPDGRKITFAARGGDYEIYVLAADRPSH